MNIKNTIKRYGIILSLLIPVASGAQNFRVSPATVTHVINKEIIEPGLEIATFKFEVEDTKEQIVLDWAIPAIDMQYVWSTQSQMGIIPDWGSSIVKSHATRQAPVVTVLNNNNLNKLTFAASDALNTLSLYSGVIEECGMLQNKVVIEPEAFKGLDTYILKIRLDWRAVPYWKSIDEVSRWWESFDEYTPMNVPDVAKQPMYSTWYSFHQELDVNEIIAECRLAKSVGCKAVIIDDGWQTMDNKRGYKYTGDWTPERIPEMKSFVDSIHNLGMKFILWYSVPFAGEASETAKKFKGKFLQYFKSYNAYVLDPRYPDVREYLIQTYADALNNWGLDGFKLDFVDQFREYKRNEGYTPDNYEELSKEMDYSNINDAADRLLTDVVKTLTAINPDILIEFRQVYIGPLMRKYGNMFRAGDCPYSVLQNRISTTNIRLLAGNTATHSDMLMWHPEETAETAALQLLNVIFSVPQVSVKMQILPKKHFEMLKFWLPWWNRNRYTLLDGDFEAYYPDLNYPLLTGRSENKLIAGIYSPNILVPVNLKSKNIEQISIVNASGNNEITINFEQPLTGYRYTIYSCTGDVVDNGAKDLAGLIQFEVPKSGLLEFKRLYKK